MEEEILIAIPESEYKYLCNCRYILEEEQIMGLAELKK